MAILVPHAHRAVYLELANRLTRTIARRYRPGEMVPSYRRLAKEVDVGEVTLRRALNELVSRGLLLPMPRKGYRIARAPRSEELRLTEVALVHPASMSRLFLAPYLSWVTGSIFTHGENQIQADTRIFTRFGKGDPEGFDTAESILSTGADAAILLGRFQADQLATFAEYDIPIVVVDHYCPDVALDYVVCDNPRAARMLAEHLAGLGHHRAAYLGPFQVEGGEDFDAGERQRGFVSAGAEVGMQLAVECRDKPENAGIDEAIRSLLAGPDAPTVLVAKDEERAERIIRAVRALGRFVPQDVSVAAVASGTRDGAITCCRMDFWEMGSKAVQILKRRAEGPRPSGPEITRVGCTLMAGETAGPPAG